MSFSLPKVVRSNGELCRRNCLFFFLYLFVEGKTFAVKTYSVLINIIRYAGVTIFHPDTNDFLFFFFPDVGKKIIGTRSE